MKRTALLLAVLLIAGCGRLEAGSMAAESPGSTQPDQQVEPATTFAPKPDLLPYAGEPPIWNLDMTVTADLFHHFLGYVNPDTGESDEELLERYGLSSGCNGMGDAPRLGFDDCLGKLLAAAGASSESLALLRDFHLIVLEVQGPGPVWVAWLYDTNDYESNGYNPDYIFTPSGVLTDDGLWSWQSYQDAIDAAKASAEFQMIDDALFPYLAGASYGQFGGEDRFMGTPIETANGWTVPLTMGLTGCHACQSEFAGRFEIDFTTDGTPAGVRFIDHCYYVDDIDRPWATDETVIALKADLPVCDPHTRYDGSVSPFQRFTMEPSG